MSIKIISKPLTIALGTALVGGLTAAAAASAGVATDDNPFAMEQITSGLLLAGDAEGSCGEAKGEGSCGEGDDDSESEGEGSCGEAEGEGSCGGASS